MKHLTRIFVAIMAAGLILPAMAQDDVVNTLHNLSSTAPATTNSYYVSSTNEVCVFCHTPHGANTTVGIALWNKGLTGATYTMYTSTTMDMAVAAAPASVSLACLTCHDGTVAMDNLINAPGSGGYVAAGANLAWTWTAGTEQLAAAAVTNVGTDLSNDHPIGITYNPALDTAFNTAASVTGAGLPLFGGLVECATCHNPHEATLPTFYRITNSASNMCTTCHIK